MPIENDKENNIVYKKVNDILWSKVLIILSNPSRLIINKQKAAVQNGTDKYFFDRSSEKFNKRLTIFSKRDVLETRCFKKFCKIHKKTTVPESNFLIKLQVSACKLIKKETLSHRCFPVNFAKFLKIPFSKKHVRWLLLECTSV